MTFGDLRAASPEIDLRVMTTCLTQGRAYEMPWESTGFFYDPATWATLFPAAVMRALDAAPPVRSDVTELAARQAEQDALAAAHSPPLRRLPDAEHLPVIVAVRMSLSFPLLISAVPLWTCEQGTDGPRFVLQWFSDGGLTSNFPLHFFDAALPTRPTFAISLDSFPPGVEPSPDESRNVDWARTNSEGLQPMTTPLPSEGFAAVAGFAAAAVNTARTWGDSALSDFPGFRDRIVRIHQGAREGGINLDMSAETIARLGARGAAGADAIARQFSEARYPPAAPVATGWDNHRWVRFRALVACLPQWADSYAAGRAVLATDLRDPPSYPFGSEAEVDLAEQLDAAMLAVDEPVAGADPATVARLTATPRRRGIIRRIPHG